MVGPTALAESKRTQDRFYFSVFLVLVVVGLFLPDDLLGRSRSLQTFCDLVAAVVPQIDVITRLGIRPDGNRLYYSILWLFSVPFFLMFYPAGRANFARGLVKPLTLAKAIALILGLSFGAVFCMFLWYGIGSARAEMAIFRVTFSVPVIREVIGVVLVMGFWACVSGVLIALEQMPKLLKQGR